MIVIELMLGLMCSLVGCMLGMVLVAPFEAKGNAVLFRQFIISIAVAAGLFAFPAIAFGVDSYFTSDHILLMVESSATAGIVLAAMISWLTAEGRVEKMLKMVPLVEPFASKNFALLDIDEDGVLSDGDLGHAMRQPAFSSPEDQKVLQFMRSNMSSIGHGVGSYTTYNASTKTASSQTVSVIGRKDLPGYAEKIFSQYRAWRQV